MSPVESQARHNTSGRSYSCIPHEARITTSNKTLRIKHVKRPSQNLKHATDRKYGGFPLPNQISHQWRTSLTLGRTRKKARLRPSPLVLHFAHSTNYKHDERYLQGPKKKREDKCRDIRQLPRTQNGRGMMAFWKTTPRFSKL
jgi:hypothetical protein